MGDAWKHRLLMQQLSGAAKESVAGFATNPGSYRDAVSQLKRSFDNPTAARDAIVGKFCSMPPLQKSSVEGLRKLLAAFNAATGTLKLLKLPDK